MKNMRGFTIIEIMIVVAVLGILSAIALPAYSNYTVRSRVSEMLAVMSKARTCVQEWNQDRTRVPSKGSVTSDTLISVNYSRSIQWDGKAVVVEANPDDLGAKLIIGLVANVDNIKGNNIITGWTCAVAEPGMFRYVPANCRNLYSDFAIVADADTDTVTDTVVDANTGNSGNNSDNRNVNGESSSNNSGNNSGNSSGNNSDNRNVNGESSSNNSGNNSGNSSGNSSGNNSGNRNVNGESSGNNSGNNGNG